MGLFSAIGALGSLIGIGAGIGSNRANIRAQERANAQNIAFQREQNVANTQFQWDMYNRQRADALSDTAAANLYNSPIEQMSRYKAAGLNPRLIYGDGGGAMASANTRQSQATPPSADAPRVQPVNKGDLSKYIDLSGIMSLAQQKEEIELIKLKQAEAKQAVNESKSREDANRVNTEDKGITLGIRKEIRDTIRDGMAASERNKQVKEQADIFDFNNKSTRWTWDIANQALNEAQKRSNIANTDARTKQIKQGIQNMIRQGILQKIEINIRKRGGNPNDPQWQKLATDIVIDLLKDVGIDEDELPNIE